MLVAAITIIVVVSVLGLVMMATGHHPDQTRAKRLAEMTPEQREREQERQRRSNLGNTGRMVEDWQFQQYAARRKQRERFRKQYDAQRKREH